MKQLLLLIFTLSTLVAATGCKKNDKNCKRTGAYSGNMQVIKDCTGTYLRYQQKDYKVCNYTVLSNYTNGSWVMAGFDKISDCFSTPPVICQMFHENEGYIEVVCVKSLLVIE